ncbi:MAG: metal transporter [Desulfobacterales bacterium]
MTPEGQRQNDHPSDDIDPAFFKLAGDLLTACQSYWTGVYRYTNEFMLPFWTALYAFQTTEKDKLVQHSPVESFKDYLELFQFNLQVAEKGLASSLTGMTDYHTTTATRAATALFNSAGMGKGEDFAKFVANEAALLEKVVYSFPRAIRAIGSEYGFHFENDGYRKIAETDRFTVYQVLPRNGAAVRSDGKPILIIPPYVLGANILAFLPGENKSYVHAYANQGIPTYVRVIKDIDTIPAVQTMTGEDDIIDTRFFCERIKAIHGNPVTLNGFCQGGFIAVVGVLTGELDGVVDALITCVAPMDGTRSKALIEYMQHLPSRFRDLGYAVKDLPNGNRVVDGKVMSWVYKLKSMEKEAPVHTFYRDLIMFGRNGNGEVKISRTAAAINHWLIYDRNDLPEAITKISFDSYTIPVTKNGTLPFKLFGREVTFQRLREKPLPYLICYGKEDDLVDSEAALAPLDFITAEVTGFPKGHGAIATSWSNPQSAFALQKRFEDGSRGPVRFQLDLQKKA